MAKWNVLWRTLREGPVWHNIARSVPCDVKTLRKHLQIKEWTDEDYEILSSTLNNIPEDFKNSEFSIQIYLGAQESIVSISQKIATKH